MAAEDASATGGVQYWPILVDCNDETSLNRLFSQRCQPEFATKQMLDWAGYLRREAKAHGCEILDSSVLTREECVGHVMSRMHGTPIPKSIR